MIDTVKRPILHHHAKFGADRSTFVISKMAASAILDF